MRAVVVILTLGALSCGGDGVVSQPPPTSAPTLTALQSSIFTPRCAVPGCHVAPGAQQGMDLSAGHFYANTVNVAVVELAGFKRVVPNDAANSYLFMKVTADPRITGEQMPFGGPYLSAAETAAIQQWIDAGALDN
ncbi:MAG TPA: hypothetical protein VFV19_08685 [Candidatus Polarisedimenticolaceae bacterium]|nr:hypothetical protein [Candidatus Polarisedimenticolaceae bacterium]